MLDKFDKKANPFKTPENYFESFNVQIMAQLPEKKKAKVIPLWKKALPWTAAAAMLIGIISFSGILSDKSTQSNVGAGYAVTNEEDFYQYLEDEVTTSAFRDMLYDETSGN